MTQPFRVLVWNCHRAHAKSPVWDYLREQNPDVALLQEVSGIPDSLRSHYACHEQLAMGKNGSPSRVYSVLLVKGRVGAPLELASPSDRVPAKLMEHFKGNLLARELLPDNGPPIKAVSVYSPAWPVDESLLVGVDVAEIGQNGTVWVSDLLWESLNHLQPDPDEAWIIAGDFNLSETFDEWTPTKPRGNREYLLSMETLGLVECLRKVKGKLTPTFRHSRGGIKHQMDHLFVTPALARYRTACDTGPHDAIFDAGLSDHLPIIADFTLNQANKPHA